MTRLTFCLFFSDLKTLQVQSARTFCSSSSDLGSWRSRGAQPILFHPVGCKDGLLRRHKPQIKRHHGSIWAQQYMQQVAKIWVEEIWRNWSMDVWKVNRCLKAKPKEWSWAKFPETDASSSEPWSQARHRPRESLISRYPFFNASEGKSTDLLMASLSSSGPSIILQPKYVFNMF